MSSDGHNGNGHNGNGVVLGNGHAGGQAAGGSVLEHPLLRPTDYGGKTVLAIGAHPDDIELGIGGTVRKLTDAGCRVVMAVCSIPSELETRKLEAARAAEILGGELKLLTPDRCSRVEDLKTYELVSMIDKLVKELKPAAVLTHGSVNWHRDHVLVYRASIAAQRISKFDLYGYYPTATRPIPVPFWPNAYVDISDTIDAKMAAIHAHNSQFHCRGLQADYYRKVAASAGRLIGVPHAEGFEVQRMMLFSAIPAVRRVAHGKLVDPGLELPREDRAGDRSPS